MSSVREEVQKREDRAAQDPFWKEELLNVPVIFLGVAIYAVGINLFLRPLHLYSGGMMGFAQLITTLLRDNLGISFGKLDVSGILYYIFNLPGLILALRLMKRRFIIKSVFSITLITVLLTLIPIPGTPILEDRITNCLVAGIMAGGGIGLVLRTGASDGGSDLIGMILIQQRGKTSIGRINLMVNAVLYGLCLFFFDVPTVIYSVIYSVFNALMCDHMHTQNINVQALIVTKQKDTSAMEIGIMGEMKRGITRLHGVGSFTNEDETILITVVSKYELAQLMSIVNEYDPTAFVMIDEGVRVSAMGHSHARSRWALPMA